MRKRIVRDLYEGEDEDIKELVIAKLKERAKVMEDQKNDDVDHACTVSSVRLDVMSVVYKNSHQPSSIKDMPGILGQCLDGLHAGSRWTYLVVMGGPHPLSNGDFAVARFGVPYYMVVLPLTPSATYTLLN